MRKRWRSVATVGGLALLTGALLAAALVYLRQAAVRGAEQLTLSLSQVIAEQTARTLQSVDQRLQLATAKLAVVRRTAPGDDEAVRQLLREELHDLPFLRALWIVDMQGRILVHSDSVGEGSAVPDREYVQAYRRPGAGFFIGPMQRSRFRGTWLMPVARPIRDAHGQVQQIIVGALEPAYFEKVWHGIDLGEGGAVALYHRGGQLLMRSPPDERVLGRNFSGLPLFSEHVSQAREGIFIANSAVDSVKRVIAYRELPIYTDLVVAVGSAYAEVLAPWRRFALLTGLVWAAAVGVGVMLTIQLRRHAESRDETQQRFLRLTQTVPQIVFISDGRGEVQFMSQRWAEVTGRPAQQALGSGWQAAIDPRERRAIVQRLRAMIAGGRQLEFEHRLRTRDGTYRWQLLRAVPMRADGDGEITWFGTATDVDDLKRAQERLREQAEQLRMAGRLTRMGGWRADLRTQRMALSEEVARVLDLAPDAEPTLHEVYAMLTPDSLARARGAIAASVEQGTPFDLEVELITSTGRHVWVRSIGEPVTDPASGEAVAIQGAQQEITLRVLMMEEIRRLNASLEERIAERTAQLARQEALFRTLAEQAPLPFWTVDPRGRVTFLSRAWYDLAGGSPPDWHGEAWLRLMHPDDLPGLQHNWIRSMVTGKTYAGTRRLRAADGAYHTMTYRAEPVRDDAGQVLFWVGVDTDITDLMANESALRLANRQLESFSYSVSHDLQSPLQRVASYAKLLQDELQQLPDGRAHHYLARIQGNAHTMSELIEGLLALAHVSEVQIIRSVVNVSDMATEILTRLQAEHPQRRVTWRVEPGLAVMGDVRLMRSVLENLVGNAWKFSARQEQAEIVVGGSRERGEYFVRDNGCGFDMAYADRLFGTFQRLHAADEFPGTGIGLATVARAISRQGGRVWAQSAPGQGATFFFTLPPA